MTSDTSHRFIDRVRLDAGVNQDDLPVIERALTQLFAQLVRFDPAKVDIGLRVKDRGRPGMKTTVELHVQGYPSMVGVSDLADLVPALNDAEGKVLHQFQGLLGRHVTRRVVRVRRGHVANGQPVE